MPPVGFEPTISAGELSRDYALDRAATGTGIQVGLCQFIYKVQRYFSLVCAEFSKKIACIYWKKSLPLVCSTRE